MNAINSGSIGAEYLATRRPNAGSTDRITTTQPKYALFGHFKPFSAICSAKHTRNAYHTTPQVSKNSL